MKKRVKFKLPKAKIIEPERTILTIFDGIIKRRTVSEINRILDGGKSRD